MQKIIITILLLALCANVKLIIHPTHNHYILAGRFVDTAIVYSDGDMCAWFGSHCYTSLGEISAYTYQNQ